MFIKIYRVIWCISTFFQSIDDGQQKWETVKLEYISSNYTKFGERESNAWRVLKMRRNEASILSPVRVAKDLIRKHVCTNFKIILAKNWQFFKYSLDQNLENALLAKWKENRSWAGN
jgi:hypothetical protein